MIGSVSWRNLWRNKVRSMVILVAVSLGLAGAIFSYAFMEGMANQGVRSAIRTQLAHVQLHHPDYDADKDLRHAADDAVRIMDEISRWPHVRAVCSRIKTTAMASTAEAAAGVVIVAVDPEREKKLSDLHTKLVEGKYLDEGDRIPALVSQRLAEELNARLRSRIVVSVVGTDSVITYGAFRVVGIYKTSDSRFDAQHLFVTKSDMEALTGFDDTKASEIAVLLEARSFTEPTKARLKKRFPQLDVKAWNEIAPSLEAMAMISEQFSYFFLIIILMALAFGIINTMLMVIMERTREIGMLMVLGMTKGRIFRMILYETVFLAAVGALTGMLGSFLLVAYFGSRGIDLRIVGAGINALGYDAVIYPELNYDFYGSIAVMVVVTAVLAAIYPALRALRLKPARALREQT